MEAAGFAPGMRGSPAARSLGLDLQAAAAAAAGGVGARRALSMSTTRPRGGHLAFLAAPSSMYAPYQEVRPPRREFALMAAAAARGAVPAAAVGSWSGSRGWMVARAAGGLPSAGAMGVLGWSVARGIAGRRFAAAGGGGALQPDFYLCAAASIHRGGDLNAPPTSYAANHGRRLLPRATLGDENGPSEDKLMPDRKAGRTLDEFLDAHPRLIAFLKLSSMALCLLICYLSAKGDSRVKLLLETAKDGAEVYTFLAHLVIILKKLFFPGSGSRR